ncbi:MAG TPA: alpha/beta hydrolase-fold protein [Bacteroidota bacterium]|nr:alpha/beta hydrolase-fold protein [Bacteroidota bacterium]
MKNSTLFIALIFFDCFALSAHVQASGIDSLNSPPPVEIAGTQSLHFTSAIMGQEFDLYVNLPRDYQDTTKSVPVVYLLDGQWDFTLLNAIFGQQYYDGFVPSVIVVGIAWGRKNPDFDFLRARDLTPSVVPQSPQSGNAPKFLQFLTTEVIPFIDAHYRTKKDDRTLIGSSLGGLFTLYTLFTTPEMFNRYVLTSPAIGWDKGVISSYEQKFAERKTHPHVKLFMADGGLESGAGSFQKFADNLKGQNIEGLEMESRILEGMGHSGGKAEGFTRGLQYVFTRPSLTLDPAVLDQYTGTYQSNSDFKVKVERENDRLVGVGPDGSKIPVFAESAEDFYAKGQYLFVHFKKNENGKVAGVQIDQFGGSQFLKKID